MAAGRTYTTISNQTLQSNTATVTFSGIPSTYTDLVLSITGYSTHSDDGARGYIQFNSDTGSNTNYSDMFLGSYQTSKNTNKNTGQSKIAYGVVGNSSTYPSHNEIHIMGYTDTAKWNFTLSKTAKYLTNANYGNRISAGQWRDTTAISSITLTVDGSYAVGTVFSLYGIKAA